MVTALLRLSHLSWAGSERAKQQALYYTCQCLPKMPQSGTRVGICPDIVHVFLDHSFGGGYTSNVPVSTLSNTQEEDEEVVSPHQEAKTPEDPEKYDHTAYFAGYGPIFHLGRLVCLLCLLRARNCLNIDSVAKGSDGEIVSEGSNNVRVSGQATLLSLAGMLPNLPDRHAVLSVGRNKG